MNKLIIKEKSLKLITVKPMAKVLQEKANFSEKMKARFKNY